MLIYYAAPLHDQSDRDRNEEGAGLLREAGYKVFLPQENGVWEQMVKDEMAAGISEEQAVHRVRKLLFHENREAITQCSVVVAHCGNRSPSEGMLWEMGYAAGLNKKVILCNFYDWRYNLMPQFGSAEVTTWLELWGMLADYAREKKETLRGEFK